MLCVGDVCLDEDTFEAIAVGMSAGPPKYVSEPSGHIRGRVSRRQGNTSLEALKVRRSINPSGRDGKLPFEGVGRWGVGAISVAAEEKLNSLGCDYEILPSFQFFSPSGWSLKEAK